MPKTKYSILQAKTEFHPIGQGCFYSGNILFEGDRQFNFVYDCGTNSNQEFVQEEITDHRIKVKREVLDLCVISHFHYDHVSGIPDLLKNTKCRRLVIPYYDKIERLIIYMLSEGTDGEHLLMLQDPLQYFGGDRFDIDEIIVLGGATGNENPELPGPVAPGPGESGEESGDLNFRSDDENFLAFVDSAQDEAENLNFFNYIKESEETNTPGKVKVAQMPYEVRVALWRFVFYCRTEEEGYEDGMDKQIETLTTYIDNYYKEQLRKPRPDVREFKDLFSSKHIKELKKIYVSVFGPHKLNGASLALYHEPLLRPYFYTHYYPPFHPPFIVLPRIRDAIRIGHLLTGDMDLETSFKLNLFQTYFRFYLSRVVMFHVMHHGSDYNWPFGVALSQLDQFPVYVICHGLGRKHHPG